MIKPKFILKSQVKNETFGAFIIEPLAHGYGHTLGTALRRVLLGSLQGAAVTVVKIDGIRHQFSTLSGLKEDIVEFILNIKQLKLQYNDEAPVKMHLSAKGKGVVTAKQIEAPSGVTIIDRDVYLGTLTDTKARLEVDFTVESGYGYSPFEDRKGEEMGAIPIDAVFTPVTRVNYKVESTRVGRMTDLDKLILEVTTDGSINPEKALIEAAQILTSYLKQIYSPEEEKKEPDKPKSSLPQSIAQLTLEELELPTRVVNALSNGEIETIADLVKTPRNRLLKIKNVGVKSLTLVEKELKKHNVELKKENSE